MSSWTRGCLKPLKAILKRRRRFKTQPAPSQTLTWQVKCYLLNQLNVIRLRNAAPASGFCRPKRQINHLRSENKLGRRTLGGWHGDVNTEIKWALRYPFYLLLCIWWDVGHSGEDQSDHFQPKGDEEQAKSREISDLSLRIRGDTGGTWWLLSLLRLDASKQVSLREKWYLISYRVEHLPYEGLEREYMAQNNEEPEKEERGRVHGSFPPPHPFLTQQHKDLTGKHHRAWGVIPPGAAEELEITAAVFTHVTANRTGFA